MNVLFACIIGYLLGSVPFALLIGKAFYRTDIRTAGSRNLGGSNAGRVLGSKAGLAVMTLDLLKVTLAMWLASFLAEDSLPLIAAGLSAAVGHCYPVFAHFRGGKAVAALYGFLFGMTVVGGSSAWCFFLPLIVFLAVLFATKIVSLSSIVSSLAAAAYVWLASGFSATVAALLAFCALIIWRHRGNLIRIARGEERKISWM